MSKRRYVMVKKHKKIYKLLTEDIKYVFTYDRRKLPLTPKYETVSDNETEAHK